VARALAPEPSSRFADARAFAEAMRAVIHGAVGDEIPVIALYVEGDATDVTTATELASAHGMTVALTAPDSTLAVMPLDKANVAVLRSKVSEFSAKTRVAIGVSRATISGHLVDGPALDVEGWAPYPLAAGLWVADGL
jgi:hypothetical protein